MYCSNCQHFVIPELLEEERNHTYKGAVVPVVERIYRCPECSVEQIDSDFDLNLEINKSYLKTQCPTSFTKNLEDYWELYELDDSLTIVMIVQKFFGITLSIEKAHEVWVAVSDIFYCAGWVCIPENDSAIADDIFSYLGFTHKTVQLSDYYSSVGDYVLSLVPFLDEKDVVEELN